MDLAIGRKTVELLQPCANDYLQRVKKAGGTTWQEAKPPLLLLLLYPPHAGPGKSTGAAPSLDTGRYEQEAVAEGRGVLEVDAPEGGYRADAGRNV